MNHHIDTKLAIVKVGGDVLLTTEDRIGLAKNVADLLACHYQIVLLHGGGPQVDRLQKSSGLEPNKIAGRRITTAADLKIIKQAICGEVNTELCQVLQDYNIPAFACSGLSGKLITAKKRPPTVITGGGKDAVDFGEVGDVTHINGGLIQKLLDAKLVPVIATLGVEADSGRVFNINADTTAVKLAIEMSADLLLLCTAVGAIYQNIDMPSSRKDKIDASNAKVLIANGSIFGGMIPKVEEAVTALDQGVGKVVIIGPKQKNAFKAIAQGGSDFGTSIINSASNNGERS